jgi:hypothetical protein
MLSPLPRRSGWVYHFARSPSRISLPRKGCRVGLRIVLFEACSAFTRVTACTLALSPIRDTHSEGFSYFVTSIAAPVASGWSGCRVGLAPTGKRRLLTAHTLNGHLRLERPRCFLIPRRECPPVSKSQKIVNLALSPAMILSRERIDAGIDADVTNKEIRALDKVSYLVNSSPAETTFGSCHRPAPSLP